MSEDTVSAPPMTTRSSPIVERPSFAAGYGIKPADPDRMAAWETVVAKLARARNYWLATVRPDGRPHVAPVWGFWTADALHFGTDPTSRKGRNLTERPDIAVHLESGDDVVILEGEVETIDDPAVVRPIMAAYKEKYAISPADGDALDAQASAILRLRPRVAFAWLESSFPDTATRFRFQD